MIDYKPDHRGITVADINKEVGFYTKFGYHVAKTRTEKPDLRLSLVTMENGNDRLELIEPYDNPLETQLHRIGKHHIAFSVDDVAEAYNLLKEDMKFDKLLLEKGVYFYTDPEGNLIELMQRK